MQRVRFLCAPRRTYIKVTIRDADRPRPTFGWKGIVLFLSPLSLSWFPLFPFGETETTKEAKDTKTFQRKSHPQISQIFTEEFKAVSFQSVKI
jgi:hypothetical protein